MPGAFRHFITPCMKPHLAYRPDIDGLRAVAVMTVVLNHLSAPLMPGGYVGVDVFFVISGYLITRIVGAEIEAGRFSFARFYARRACRIFPALFAVLAATLVAGYFVLLPSDYKSTLRSTLATLLFASNISFWRELGDGYFAAAQSGLNPLLHTWSLAVEEQFYLLFPVALLLGFRFFRRRIPLIFFIVAALSLVSAALLVQSRSVAVFFLPMFRAWELLAGALLAMNALPALTSQRWREITASAGLLVIVAAAVFYDDSTIFPGLSALAPVLGAAAVIHAGSGGASTAGRLLQWRPVVYIGLISYSLYLWHWPVIILTRYAAGLPEGELYAFELLVASLVLASLSYHLIEQPFRQHRQINARCAVPLAAACASGLAVVSAFGVLRGGFENRFAPIVVQLDEARAPKIPYQGCDDKPVTQACTTGRAGTAPTVLLWGDSHMVAWAPAFDELLARRGESALLVPTLACPPLLGADNAIKANCAARNEQIKNHLLANPDIRTVVLSAFWSTYFRPGGPLSSRSDGTRAEGVAAASETLAATIQWLRDHQRQALLMGPVPVHDESVPLGLAMAALGRQPFTLRTADDQRRRHAAFYEVAERARRVSGPGDFRFIDPVRWLCRDTCRVTSDGVSLYRDGHHLSVAGALSLLPQLSRRLETARIGQTDDDASQDALK